MKNKFCNPPPPPTGGPKLLHGSIGSYRKTKTKNENSDNISIVVKLCSSEPQTNPYNIIGRWFFLVYWKQIFTTMKTIFKIFIFCISTGPYGGMWNLLTPCTGDSSELISKCLSSMILYNYSSYFNARVKRHLEPTHLKSSPLFTFSTKSLGQDSPIHLFSKIIGSSFTTAKIKLGEDSPS